MSMHLDRHKMKKRIEAIKRSLIIVLYAIGAATRGQR